MRHEMMAAINELTKYYVKDSYREKYIERFLILAHALLQF